MRKNRLTENANNMLTNIQRTFSSEHFPQSLSPPASSPSTPHNHTISPTPPSTQTHPQIPCDPSLPTTRNQVVAQAARGFESLLFRHNLSEKSDFIGLFDVLEDKTDTEFEGKLSNSVSFSMGTEKDRGISPTLLLSAS